MTMRRGTLRPLGLVVLLIVAIFLSGFVIDVKPQTVFEGEAEAVAAELNNQGVKLYEEQKYNQALANFVTASALDTGFWQGHYNCAVVLVAMGRLEEALHHLELSMEIDPWNPRILSFYRDLSQKVNRTA